MLYNALYARQSVEKKDSISVESQLAYCRYEAHGETCMEYTDKGFSGKDTHRPEFERMMQDIRAGKVKRVIVYKLDRISRSILDFANMMEIFQQYHVEFLSSTEKFDTSTPIGRAMLHICIVFAQLERETIQKRVTDAYYARSRKGLYMGGRVPYGYRLTRTVIDNIHTAMYEELLEESGQIKLIYTLYADGSHSLGDIVRYLHAHQITHLRGSCWNTARLSEMLRNPVYVQADMDVYRFFQSQGVSIYNPVNDFTGTQACYLYKEKASPEKTPSPAGSELVLAPHKGFIPSGLWLACRKRCLTNRQSAKTCKPQNSWLLGKVKCGRCGYALTLRKSNTRQGRYFVCSQSGKCCQGTGCTIYANVLESYMSEVICRRLSEWKELPAVPKNTCFSAAAPSSGNTIKMQLALIDEEIDMLLSRLAEADKVLMTYINNRISVLDAHRQTLLKESYSQSPAAFAGRTIPPESLVLQWQNLSFSERQTVLDIFVKVIRIADGRLEIEYYF